MKNVRQKTYGNLGRAQPSQFGRLMTVPIRDDFPGLSVTCCTLLTVSRVAVGVFASRAPLYRHRLRRPSILHDTAHHQGVILVPRRRFAMLVPGDAVSGHHYLPDTW